MGKAKLILAPLYITVPNYDELRNFHEKDPNDLNVVGCGLDIVDLLSVREKGVHVTARTIVARNPDLTAFPVKAEEADNEAPGNCIVATAIVLSLAALDAVHRAEPERLARKQLAHAFADSPFYAQSFAFGAHVPAWWPDLLPREAYLSTILHMRREAVRARLLAILKEVP
jgi:hypothetical protein